jgi:dihydroorotate dehydrogenase (NAD+) catalytic subunit
MKPDMRVRLCGLELRNPIIAASGTFGYGIEFEEIVTLEKLGAFVTKGLSLQPMPGNPAPRIVETPAGMINAIGLQNVGVRAFISDKLAQLRRHPAALCIANVFGFSIADYVAVIKELNQAEGIAAYELNASCPNTRHGGQTFGTDAGQLSNLVTAAREAVTRRDAPRPLIVKLSPNVTSIAEMARAAEQAGADALSLVNTFVSLAIDVETRTPRIANVTGGLSGPAIKPIALRMVWEAARAVQIPVIGLGGIASAEDAVEFLLAGAAAVQIGTASYADPRAAERIARALETWCVNHQVERVADLKGALRLE